MQFVVLAYDDKDKYEKRLALREQHLAMANELQESGHLLYGVALLDDDGRASGSVMVTEFESRAELDKWLDREPYVLGEVWIEMMVFPCKVGPMFAEED